MTFEHRFVPGADALARTFILLHGTGGDENSLIDLGQMLDPSANMLGVRGRSTEEGVNRFFRRFSEGQFDVADISAQAKNLADFLTSAQETYGYRGERTLVGYSNGANMAAALLLIQPRVAESAVLLRAMLPLEPPNQPDLTGKRVLISSGSVDPMAPIESSTRLAEVLKSLGAKVEHQVTGGGHGLGREDLLSAAKWLNSDLG